MLSRCGVARPVRVARGVAHPAGARGRAAAAAVVPRVGQRVCVEVVLRRVRKRHIVPLPRPRARHAVCQCVGTQRVRGCQLYDTIQDGPMT